MAKLRKMLGDITSQECIALMRVIETQSTQTLATWAIDYAKNHYLEFYLAVESADQKFVEGITTCETYLKGHGTLKEIKPIIKMMGQMAREATEDPIMQAAARAISVACAVIQTPTNALGFLFYGAAAVAYHQGGLTQEQGVYNELATAELQRALQSLQAIAIIDEPNPAKINWNC